MAGEPKLAGAPRLLLFEHHFLKGKHRELENHFANSPRRSTRDEKEQGGVAAMESFGEIQNAKRGRLGLGFWNWDAKGGCGVGKELYSAQKGKKISKFSGLGRLGSVRFCSQPSPSRLRQGRRRALRSGSRASAKGALGPGHQQQRREKGRVRAWAAGKREMGRGRGKWESWALAGFHGGVSSFFSCFLFWFLFQNILQIEF